MRKNADRDKDSRVTARGVLVQSETWVMGGGRIAQFMYMRVIL